MKIREIEVEDIPQIIGLWREAGDYHEWVDTHEALVRKIQRDKGLFLVAEADGSIVATVMGGFDGRMGSVARLIVTPSRMMLWSPITTRVSLPR